MIRWLRSLIPLGKRVDHHLEASMRTVGGTPPSQVFPPPTHFSNPNHIPKTYSDLQLTRENGAPLSGNSTASQSPLVAGSNDNWSQAQQLINENGMSASDAASASASASPQLSQLYTSDEQYRSQVQLLPQQQQQHQNGDLVKDLVLLATMCTLIYLTLDNYIGRIRAEKLQAETAAISARTKQLLQTRFKQQTQQRDVQILAERKKSDRRDFKMSLHIAMLRKQLRELGVEPSDIDKALKEFNESVKIDNSIHNVSGQALWLEDTSPLKEYLPDIHEYDRQGNNKD